MSLTAAAHIEGLLEFEDFPELDVMGDFAIVHASTSYTLPDGTPAAGRYTDCWAKQNGRWLAVSAHVSR